jgi:hypothetical protein
MSSYVSIDIVAGLSFVEIARAIKAYRPQVGTGIGFGVIILVILIQLFFSMSAFPYYYNFYNPLMGGNANASWQAVVGYGEGLDLAATYLSQKPEAQHLKAMSWYPIGCFSYFFEGETSPIFVADEWNQAKADTLKTMDYLVIYVGNERREETKDLALALGGVSPEHVIVFNGIEYAKIYKVSDMPEGIFQVE